MNRKSVSCPVETTLAVIHGRWKVLVIHHLLDGVKRFGALHRALPGISHRTLTKQLRELEAARLIRRKVYREVPPKVEYSLTPLGASLQPVLLAMHAWGETYARKGHGNLPGGFNRTGVDKVRPG
jgi:DNA-binding HxlR family transcriptional regulator